MRFILKGKLNYRDRSNHMQFVMKTRQDNDLTDYTGAIYDENETKLSWSIGLGAVYDEN